MKLSSFIHNERGGVLITTGLSILFLIGIAGASIDLGRQQLVKARTQQSSDAAALAAATIDTAGVDRNQVALRYFNLNFSNNYMGLTRPAPAINVGSDTIAVSASNTMAAAFTDKIGVQSMGAGGRTVVANQSTTKSNMDYDVVAVIDESGSTAALLSGGKSRMDEEKGALRDMIAGLFPDSESSNKNLRLGVVGYTGYISTVGALTSSKTQALSYINNLKPRCENFDHWGMEAGLNMITGNWTAASPVSGGCMTRVQNTSVPPAATSRSDGEKLSKAKHVVFLTDGYIMVEPAPCDHGYYPGCQNYPIFLKSCDALKDAGVIVYTISFVSQSPGDVTTLKSCASTDPTTGQPRYFYAPDAESLRKILGSVGETIRSIRITE